MLNFHERSLQMISTLLNQLYWCLCRFPFKSFIALFNCFITLYFINFYILSLKILLNITSECETTKWQFCWNSREWYSNPYLVFEQYPYILEIVTHLCNIHYMNQSPVNKDCNKKKIQIDVAANIGRTNNFIVQMVTFLEGGGGQNSEQENNRHFNHCSLYSILYIVSLHSNWVHLVLYNFT